MALTERPPAMVADRDVAFAEPKRDCVVVRLRGEHDASTTAELSETLAQAISLGDADLAIDMSGVEFVDAATVGILLRARRYLRLRSRHLLLRDPPTCVLRLLSLCELGMLVESERDGNLPDRGRS